MRIKYLVVLTLKTRDLCHQIGSTTNKKITKPYTKQIRHRMIKLEKKSTAQKIIIKRMRKKIKIKNKIYDIKKILNLRVKLKRKKL